MSGVARDIITTLFEDQPTGIKKIKFDLNNIFGIYIPRSNKATFDSLDIDGSEFIGVYILFGEDPKTTEKTIYVGQTDGIKVRLNDHIKKKEWREYAVFFSIDSNDFSKSDLNYLENEMIKKFIDDGIYKCENMNNGNKNNLKQSRINILNQKLQEIYDILIFLGFEILKGGKVDAGKIFYAKKPGVEAEGIYDGGKMTILEGSYGKMSSNSNLPIIKQINEKREILRKQGIIKIDNKGNKVLFIKNYTFDSPSAAAKFLYVGSISGRDLWVNKKNDKKLKDL